MNSYRYRLTMEVTAGQKGEPVTGKSLSFETHNHDDVLSIVERLQARRDFSADTAASLGVGLKLLGEVVLEHRNDPLFAPLREPLREFIARLKGPRPQTSVVIRAAEIVAASIADKFAAVRGQLRGAVRTYDRMMFGPRLRR